MKWTPRQIEKYNRQKYISFLEKITKNLFKMFRDKTISQDIFTKRFFELKVQLNRLPEVVLSSQYHREMQNYIDNLYMELKGNFDLNSVRELNMTNLNRIQKLKNRASYRKDKHKGSVDREVWN
jgi:hypothetical protein